MDYAGSAGDGIPAGADLEIWNRGGGNYSFVRRLKIMDIR